MQLNFFDEPLHTRHRDPPRVAVPPVDPQVAEGDAPDLSRQSELILARLRKGPASVTELESFSGARRVAARILDLKEAGHAIEGFWFDRSSRLYGYRLESNDT